MTPKFYAAARFSQVFVEDGYPLPGNGDLNTYYYNPRFTSRGTLAFEPRPRLPS